MGILFSAFNFCEHSSSGVHLHYKCVNFNFLYMTSSPEECLTRDGRAAGSSITGVTVLFLGQEH